MIVRFEPRSPLSMEIQERVEAWVATQDPRRVRTRMLHKTAWIVAWVVASYGGLVFLASEWWHGLALSTSLGLAMSSVGFGIQHDANHGAYPVGRRFRRVLGFFLDLMGGSSYLWRFQHNINHHSFTNVAGADNDISVGAFARLCPAQPRRTFHRFQHVYLWPMYSLLALNWFIWADWRDFVRGAIGSNPFPRPTGTERVLFWLGKGCWVAIWLIVPLTLHPAPVVIAFLVWTYLVLGFTMAVVFQLAHVVEEASFPLPSGQPARASCDFVTHQLATTVNFAPGSRWLNWYLGGLNFQIEHHLFPRLCHLHYPAIAPMVEAICRKHGAPYKSHPTFRAALASHGRWLRRMGGPTADPPDTPARAQATHT